MLLIVFLSLSFISFFYMFHLKAAQHSTTQSPDNLLSLSAILLQEGLPTTATPISTSVIIQDQVSPQKEDVQKKLTWKDFVKLPALELSRKEADKMSKQWNHFTDLNYCPAQVIDALAKPGLSNIEFDW